MKLKIIGIIAICIAFFGCKKCVSSHKELRHIEASTIYICTMQTKNGCMVMMPVTTQAYDKEVDVCDEYEAK